VAFSSATPEIAEARAKRQNQTARAPIFSAQQFTGFQKLQRTNSPHSLGQNDLVPLFEGDNRFFPVVRLTSLCRALAAVFAPNVERIDLGDFDFEEVLHSLADLGFVRARIGNHRVLVETFALTRALFGQADGFDDFKAVHES